MTYFDSGNERYDLLAMIDTAVDLVEIWDTDNSPYNAALKRDWLERAKQLGVEPQ